MDYQEAYDYLQSFTDYEKATSYLYSPERFDLRRVAELLARLGNPHLGAKTLHIAGSKGKGSTAAMLAAVLTEAGYRTGLFTSPHLLDFRERMRVDGKLIAGPEMARLVAAMQPHVEAVQRDGRFGSLTTFELITALAFAFFAEHRVDVQVVEAGLGGRLDATNVVSPTACAITAISLDHQAILGDTIEKIATEKGGIIKEGRPVVSSPQDDAARRVIERACAEKHAPLVLVGRDVIWGGGELEGEGQRFWVKTRHRRYVVWLPLLGAHQRENAATVLGVVEVLRDAGVPVGDEAVDRGLRGVVWPGRLQVVRRRPTVVLDGAHNGESARRLVAALRESFAYARLVVVLGTSSDKDIDGIFRELAPVTDRLILTRSRHPRAATPEMLSARAGDFAAPPTIAGDVETALRLAITEAAADDLVCVTGSLFVVADALAILGSPSIQ